MTYDNMCVQTPCHLFTLSSWSPFSQLLFPVLINEFARLLMNCNPRERERVSSTRWCGNLWLFTSQKLSTFSQNKEVCGEGGGGVVGLLCYWQKVRPLIMMNITIKIEIKMGTFWGVVWLKLNETVVVVFVRLLQWPKLCDSIIFILDLYLYFMLC